MKLKRFIEDQSIVGTCLIERGGALMHKHFQMVMKGKFTSLPALNQKKK